jgi:flagellar motor switch protein FliN/FliY
MQTPSHSNAPKSLEGLFARALAQPISDACELNWQITVSDGPLSAPPVLAESAMYRFAFDAPMAGEAYLLVRHASATALGLRGIAKDPATFGEEHTSTLLKVFKSAAEEAGHLLAEFGSIKVELSHIASPELSSEEAIELWLESEDENTRVSVLLFFDRQLVASFQNVAAQPLAYPAAPVQASSNLDLVLDVELNVTLRFGQRQLPLREILDLTSGSVVELDRQVDEPIELVLDGKVVARGEAVIIDGNYGMRITQVLQPLAVQ